MARGFESKDVEYQQAEAERGRAARAPMTDEQRGRVGRTRALEMSLARLRGDLGRARAAAHRAMIEQAIATLESELASLS